MRARKPPSKLRMAQCHLGEIGSLGAKNRTGGHPVSHPTPHAQVRARRQCWNYGKPGMKYLMRRTTLLPTKKESQVEEENRDWKREVHTRDGTLASTFSFRKEQRA